MHEKILQGVTVGVVAGLLVYWFTSAKNHSEYAGPDTNPNDYKPLIGAVSKIPNGTASDVCCCASPCSLTTNGLSYAPLASDYLPCGGIISPPAYRPTVSKWNLGVSLQFTCCGIDLHSGICRQEAGTSFPYGLRGPNTIAQPIRVSQPPSNAPKVPIIVCCTEVV